MISTGITGTARQGTWPNSARLTRVNTLQRAAPPGEDRLARARHVRCVRIVADQLEREVGLDPRADVEVAAGVERPAAVGALPGAQIDGDLVLERLVDLAEEMLEQDVLRRIVASASSSKTQWPSARCSASSPRLASSTTSARPAAGDPSSGSGLDVSAGRQGDARASLRPLSSDVSLIRHPYLRTSDRRTRHK